ncbi:sam-dependent methyltransferase coq5 family protein [Colletotrichum incanum]|uniref:Arsenite methyltransferase n=1 Tax=Colletotrichum incanum TaxID=1573173 RepID=A0A161WMC6_COLIC|nr:sam-dependent methyltransferase coq5 family protein [Colletotrichum incanum]OHW98152.1 SAM-dependent methyltransferase coq5 family protein [Colletotrichum incanum]
MESDRIYESVHKRYGSVVRSSTGEYENAVAKAFGYTEDELVGIPEGANLGLSCGNPHVLAKLREGETVIDLGSGAGFDVFSAAKRVGLAGKAIGVDMNRNMIDKAMANAERAGCENVKFVESQITSIPLPDEVADCVISNCVINLVPTAEKSSVFHEIYRLLKPGGRVAISDILARKEFTQKIKRNAALYVGCVAGASQVAEYDAFLRDAGFNNVIILDSKSDLNVYYTALGDETSCCGTKDYSKSKGEESCVLKEKVLSCGASSSICAQQEDDHLTPSEAKEQATSLGVTDLNEWAGSFKIYAMKPKVGE